MADRSDREPGMKISRIDIIGQNGPTGEHYDEELRKARMSCWSCNHYEARPNGQHKAELCGEGHNERVPHGGGPLKCSDFEYAPGSDEQEADNG